MRRKIVQLRFPSLSHPVETEVGLETATKAPKENWLLSFEGQTTGLGIFAWAHVHREGASCVGCKEAESRGERAM